MIGQTDKQLWCSSCMECRWSGREVTEGSAKFYDGEKAAVHTKRKLREFSDQKVGSKEVSGMPARLFNAYMDGVMVESERQSSGCGKNIEKGE